MHSAIAAIDGMARRPSINALIKHYDINGIRAIPIIVACLSIFIPKRMAVRRSRNHNDGLGRRIDADALELGRGVVVRGRAVRHAVGKGGGASWK